MSVASSNEGATQFDKFNNQVSNIRTLQDANAAYKTFKQICETDGSIPLAISKSAAQLFKKACFDAKAAPMLLQMSLSIHFVALGFLDKAPIGLMKNTKTLSDFAHKLEKNEAFQSLDEALQKHVRAATNPDDALDIADSLETLLMHRLRALDTGSTTQDPDLETLRGQRIAETVVPALKAIRTLCIQNYENSKSPQQHAKVARLHFQTYSKLSDLENPNKNVDDTHQQMMKIITPELAKEPDKDRAAIVNAQCYWHHLDERAQNVPYSEAVPVLAERLQEDLKEATEAYIKIGGIKKPDDNLKSYLLEGASHVVDAYSRMLDAIERKPGLKAILDHDLKEHEKHVSECFAQLTKYAGEPYRLLQAANFEIRRPNPDLKQAESYLQQYTPFIKKQSKESVAEYRAYQLIVQVQKSINATLKDYKLEDFLRAVKVVLASSNPNKGIVKTLLDQIDQLKLMNRASKDAKADYDRYRRAVSSK